MSTVNKSALVPFSPGQMFALVDDIESYPEFLPWCSGSQVLERGENEVTASLEISHSGFHKSFTTRNFTLVGDQITITLLDGPFKKLEGIWRFLPLGEEGCKVTLDLEFEFNNRLLGMTLSGLLGHMAANLVDAFTQRASQIYG